MAYVLTLLAALGLFIWATPAHTVIADSVRRISATASQTTASGSMPFKPQVDSVITSVRTKSMELLREQLRRMIDELVR